MAGRIRWGIAGSGGIARRRTIPEGIVPACNAQLEAVFDIDSAANEAVASAFGARAVRSLNKLLAADVDAVYIATPAHVHFEQVRASLAAGKHVLCEKPLGMTVGEAEAMAEAASRAGLRLRTAFMMRFHAQHQAALRLIQEGRIGTPVYARAQLSCWYPPIRGAWRQDPALGGGGSLMDMGGHCIDLLEMLLSPVRRVACFVRNSVHAYTPEDSAAVLIEFENGALGAVDTFFCIPDSACSNMLEIYGSRGSILARGTIGQGAGGTMVAHFEEGESGYAAAQERSGAGGIEIAPEPVNPYRAEIEDFSQALLENREPSLTGGAGLHSQRVLTACYESARTGAAVEL